MSTITGGAGADSLTGGLGADTFVYLAVTDSAASVAANAIRTFDLITDFTTGDRINIALINVALTNGAAGTSITVTDIGGIGDEATFATIAADTAIVALTASVAGGALQAFTFHTSGATAGHYLLINVDLVKKVDKFSL